MVFRAECFFTRRGRPWSNPIIARSLTDFFPCFIHMNMDFSALRCYIWYPIWENPDKQQFVSIQILHQYSFKAQNVVNEQLGASACEYANFTIRITQFYKVSAWQYDAFASFMTKQTAFPQYWYWKQFAYWFFLFPMKICPYKSVCFQNDFILKHVYIVTYP